MVILDLTLESGAVSGEECWDGNAQDAASLPKNARVLGTRRLVLPVQTVCTVYPPSRMPHTSGEIMLALESIAEETRRILAALDDAPAEFTRVREVKRRVVQIRTAAHELIDWLSEERLETPPS